MTKDSKALTAREPQELSITRPQPTPMDLLQAALAGGITEQNIAVVERMAALAERFEDRNAEKEFSRAFVALQADLPVIVAKTIIPNRGKYEKFEDVMEAVGPLLTRHAFTVSFSNDFKEGRIIETCHLSHGGVTKSNSFAVRVSGKADTETQADCKAATTAKRNALLNALNIVIRQDCLNEEDDPRLEGVQISEDTAFELERRVKETNSDRVAFLKFAGATGGFDTIPASAYERCDAMLRRKEGAR